MNHCSLVGRVARSPITKFELEGGAQTCSFTLSIAEQSYGPNRKDYHLYVPCTSWGRAAEQCSLVNQGDLVAIQGRLTWRKQVGKCKVEHSQLCVRVQDLQVLETALAVGA